MEEQSTTKFNAGVSKLIRIDRLRQKIHFGRETNNFKLWASALSGWREEMTEKMGDKENDECDRFENNINETINSNKDYIKINYLKKYGLYLSKLDYKYGYGMPDKDDDDGL